VPASSRWGQLARILLPPLVVGALLLVFLQSGPGRRLLVRIIDPGPRTAAAAQLSRLEPTFDGPDASRPQLRVVLEPVISQVPQPTDLAFVPGHEGQVVVLSKTGTAWMTKPGTASPPTAWYQAEVATTSELGLLGIAFHPKFQDNGRLFVHLNPTETLTRVLRLRTDPRALTPPVVEAVILEVAQPYQNHDGGQLSFGPDGYLYLALGDGGYRADPHDHGQNLGSLLGKILRLDVDSAEPYAIPQDNPLRDRPGARPEIWAYGLRNPWRFAFEPGGRMVVGDVGQDRWEEIDLVTAGDNLGWRLREADRCFDPPEGCPTAGLVDPIWKYGRDEGVSVTGGVVWTAPGPLSGQYLFGDFATGRLWALQLPQGRAPVSQVTALGRFSLSPSAFQRTPTGEVWVTDFGQGGVYRIVAAQSSAEPR
jgi:glucose/arabinose dehydrogenase